MDEETISEISRVDKTNLLFSTGTNECSVTNLPYETPDARRKLIEIVEQAIKERKTAVFIYGDMDNLKEFNDLYGHDVGDLAIRRMVSGSQEVLAKQKRIELVCLFRPQSGGDEIEILMVLNESEADLSNEVKESLNKPFILTWNGNSKEVNCSFGVSSVRFSGSEDANKQFEDLETKAEENLDTIKAEKVISQVNAIIDAGRKIGVDEYRELIANAWLVRKLTGTALDLLFKHFQAKIVKQILPSKR